MSDDRRSLRLNEAFLYVDDEFLDIVEQEKELSKTGKKKLLRIVLGTAACFCLLMALPVMVIAYNSFGLRDLLISGDDKEQSSMSLIMYREKAEIQALKEWQEFLKKYDSDKKIYNSVERGEIAAVTRADWLLYGVYCQEMGEKIDEIAGRYGLKLHTEKINISPEILDTIPVGKFMDDSSVTDVCIYEDGSLKYEGNTILEGYGRLEFQFDYALQGTFCATLPVIDETEEYEEWQYISSCGEAALLIHGDSCSFILAESEQCIASITVLNESNAEMTETALQELAEKIDFSVLKDKIESGIDGKIDLKNYDIVSLSGYRSGPEAKAAAEWRDFLEEYDKKVVMADENGAFVVEGRRDWSLYSVYNYEMGWKLDEIADKYELKLYSEMNCVSPEEMEYRVGGDFMKECTKYQGYIYEDGTFGFLGDVESNDGKIRDFQFVRAVKGTFVDTFLNIGQVEDYMEWQYVSECGEPVLLALGSSKALIFADFEECFISVNILFGSDTGMTEEDLREIADRIDFKILKEVKIPDMRGDSKIM